jgi:hypothetical protein
VGAVHSSLSTAEEAAQETRAGSRACARAADPHELKTAASASAARRGGQLLAHLLRLLVRNIPRHLRI